MKTKFCKECKQEKPVDQFYKNKNHKDGLSYKCQNCSYKRKTEPFPKTEWGFKYCSHCKQKKSIKEFFKSKNTKSGFSSWCITCIYLRNKKYQKTHKNEEKVRLKKYSKTAGGIYLCIKHCADTRQIDFNIKKDDFIKWHELQPKTCIYCGRNEKEVLDDYNGKYKRLTIDRKNNDIGYKINNIALCCYRCNIIKGTEINYKQMCIIGKFINKTLKKEKLLK